ncbi:hypothetical protein ACQ4PT_021766 [Festuca glaucescens]
MVVPGRAALPAARPSRRGGSGSGTGATWRTTARFKVVFSHGFTGSRLDSLRASPEVAEELGVYMVGFDRAVYGESEPNPARSVESAALDMADLADALGLGDKFYVVGFSLGCHPVWGALRYIPDRIAGAAMLAPSCLPLPTSTVVANTTYLPNKRDAEIRRTLTADGTLRKKREMATQQGIQESYYRDMAVMFGKWEFDPMALPEPAKGCPVHLWQGDEDGLVPVALQRHVAGSLGWVNYHELPGTGHFLSAVPGLGDTVLRTLFG